jgi:penicillin amidase
MGAIHTLLRLGLGKRLPVTEGALSVPGLEQPISVARDRYGIPHITAHGDLDAWFGLGFCQGQDRSFQVESLVRVVRGTTARLVGADGIGIDRMARRIGFHVAAAEHEHALSPTELASMEAFVAGLNAGRTLGARKTANEFALLRAEPSPLSVADILGLILLQAFALASNWDAELARLAILENDGPEALEALDPAYPEWHPVTSPPGATAGAALAGLRADVARFRRFVPLGGASNNWALTGAHTATGRPLLANDPHLAPLLPPHWYLAHVTTPEWSVAGACLAGTPGFGAAHNGHVAWGVTAGLIDNTDLYVERIGPDGRSVLRGDGYVPCEIRREVIEVKGGDDIVEEVLITPHGPVVGPALPHAPEAISMAATWLRSERVGAQFDLARARTVAELRDALELWHGPSLNVVMADDAGSIGWKLIGEAPLRRAGVGALPLPAWDPEVGWDGTVPYASLPGVIDPAGGRIATANTRPVADGDASLGVDWIEGYRLMRINELLAERDGWDLTATLTMQLDTVTPAWAELRDQVLAVAPSADARTAHELLDEWDGDLHRDSAAASVFVLWLTEMQRRVAFAKAPIAADFAVGKGFAPEPLVPNNLFTFNRTGHLVRLLRERPEGWFDDWDREISGALRVAEQTLRSRHGDDPANWRWGDVRPLTLTHAVGGRTPLDKVFNIGPIRWSGDFTTVSQSGAPTLDPLGNPSAIASLRMAVDVGNWDAARFSLPGGQSGNPLSPHYGDQVEAWRQGIGLPMPYSVAAVAAATVTTLHLVPD